MSNTTRLAKLEAKYGYLRSPRNFSSLLAASRKSCEASIQPQTRAEYNTFVASCMLDQLSDREQVVYANRQYVLTLWPAFVAFICSLGADPGYIVYDSFGWAMLFGFTCGGLPGLSNSLPPHHLQTLTIEEAQNSCENWVYDTEKPRQLSKTLARRHHHEGLRAIIIEWTCFLFSTSIFLAFLAVFTCTLKDTFSFLIVTNQWWVPAVWYYIAITPAMGGAIIELVNDSIELYEPVTSSVPQNLTNTESGQMDSDLSLLQRALAPSKGTPSHIETIPMTLTGPGSTSQLSRTAETQRYCRSHFRTSFHLYLRMIYLQFRKKKFRILVKPRTKKGLLGMFNAGGAIVVALGRVAIFAAGSCLMGDLMFMPWPNDQLLFVLLLFTTVVPRLVWPTFWFSGLPGADLVVWVHTI